MTDFMPHEAPVKEAQALPVTLPAKLVGRDSALGQVHSQLKEGNPVLLHGSAGVGKTALAATLAGIYTQQPGGVLWLDVNNPSLDELLVRVGRAYQVDEITRTETPTGMIGAVENTLRGQKPFIVLDGTIQPDVASRFISRCVDGLPLVMTMETKIDGPWAALELNRLEAEQAATLFKQSARLTNDDHDIDVYGLVKLVNNMPLGIVVAARSMIVAKKMPGEYLRIMQQMAASAGGAGGPITALTTAFRTLTGALQGLILMMGATFRGRASAELLSSISNAPQDSVKQAMNLLAQLNLITINQRYDDPYYRMHPIVHAFAQASLRGSDRLDDLQTKFKDTVLDYARQYSAAGNYDKLAAEMDNIVAAARWSTDRNDRTVATELVNLLSGAGDFITERGYLYELLQLRALGAVSSTAFPAYVDEDEDHPEDDFDEGDDDQDESLFAPPPMPASTIFDDLDDEDDEDEMILEPDEVDEDLYEPVDTPPEDLINLETDDLAELRSSLAAARQFGDEEKQVEALEAIARVQVEHDMENEAIGTYDELLTLQEDRQDNTGMLETLRDLARLMQKTGNAQAAVMQATRGARLAEELGASDTRMHLLVTLGDARQDLGESGQAVQDYNQSLVIAQQNQEPEQEAIILYKLGYAQMDDGDPDRAIETWEKALARFKTQGRRNYEGRVLGGLGNAYSDLERWSEAVNFHTSALYIAREVGDKEEETLQLTSLAYAAKEAGQLGEALLRYRQALHLAYEMDDRDIVVSLLVDTTRLLLESRKHVGIAELLIDDALTYNTADKDVEQLKERVESEKRLAEAYEVDLIPVKGTAQLYAANAYRVLEEG